MTQQSAKTKEISLEEEFGDVAVKVHGVRVEVRTDGSILAYTDGSVKVCPLTAGTEMPDGTIYAGVSPDTGKAMYAAAADAPLTLTFNQAKEYATKLDVHGHRDWRVPTEGELNELFNNRAVIGGLNMSGPYPAGWYGSSAQNDAFTPAGQRFSDGYRCLNSDDDPVSLRCVR